MDTDDPNDLAKDIIIQEVRKIHAKPDRTEEDIKRLKLVLEAQGLLNTKSQFKNKAPEPEPEPTPEEAADNLEELRKLQQETGKDGL